MRRDREGAVTDETKLQLPGTFVKCPTDLLTRSVVSGDELKLYLLLLAHAMDKGECRPGIQRLSTFLGCSSRWTRRLVTNIESKGLVTVDRRRGRVNIYKPKRFTEVRNSSSPVDNQVGNHSSSVSPEVRNQSSSETDKRNREEEKSERQEVSSPSETRPPADMVPEKSRKRKSSQKQLSREEVEQAIDGLDLGRFREKYPSLDIDREFESFRDYYLHQNNARTGRPNWKRWNDCSRAFHSWCRKASEWAQERKTQQPEPTGQPPDLTNYQMT